MGSTHKSSRTSRRINQPTVGETKRELTTTDWREILRIGYNRVYVHRLERVLLPPDQRSECHKAWNSSTTQRMDNPERCDAEAVCQVPDSSIDHPVYVRTEPSDVLGMPALSIRRTVLFDENIAVFTPNDWPADVYREARKGYWMRAAQDRLRFERRIKITELLLGNIFTDDHRDRVCCRLINV